MKKIVIFMLITAVLYANNVEILEKEQNLIENEMKKYKDGELLEYSEFEYIGFQKNLLLKEIEIFNERIEARREYFRLCSELKKITKKKELNYLQLLDYSKKYQTMINNKEMSKKNEINNIFYLIEHLKNEEEKYKRNETYITKQLAEIIVSKKEEKKTMEEMTKEKYKFLFKLLEREIEIIKINGKNNFDFVKKEKGKEILEISLKKELEEIKNNMAKKEIELKDFEGDLKVIEIQINLKSEELETIKGKIERGISSETELIEKNIKYIELENEKINIEENIEYLKMELDE